MEDVEVAAPAKMSKSEMYCRTCLRDLAKTEIVISLDYAEPQNISYKEKLAACIPTLALEAYEDPVLCMKCSHKLNTSYSFHTMCLKTEESLQTLNSKRAIADYDKINQLISLELEGFIKKTPNEKLVAVKTEPVEVSQKTGTVKTRSSISQINKNKSTEKKGPKKSEIERLASVPHIKSQLRQRREFQCNLCAKSMRSRETLASHVRLHNCHNNSFRCTICHRECFEKARLAKHMLSHSVENGKVQLAKKRPMASRNTSTKARPRKRTNWSGKKRSRLTNNIAKVVASKDNKVVKKKEERKENPKKYVILKDFDMKKVQCKVCSKIINRTKITVHLLRHNNDRRFKCHKCDQKFYENYELTKHLKVRHNIKVASRSKTSQVVTTESRKSSSRRSTTSSPKVGTNAGVFPLENFETHYLNTMHDLDDPPPLFAENPLNMVELGQLIPKVELEYIQPPVLEMEISDDDIQPTPKSAKDLRMVRQPTHEANVFLCEFCPITCTTEEELQLHQKIHELPDQTIKTECINICDVCNKEFSSDDEFLVHLETHVKLDEPEYCEETDLLNEDILLDEIINSPTEETENSESEGRKCKKNYFCKICSRFYSDKDHEKMHIKGRPYKCCVCSTAFMAKSSCQRHVQNAHPGVDLESCVVTEPGDARLESSASTDKNISEDEFMETVDLDV